jgi:hypothetical protein
MQRSSNDNFVSFIDNHSGLRAAELLCSTNVTICNTRQLVGGLRCDTIQNVEREARAVRPDSANAPGRRLAAEAALRPKIYLGSSLAVSSRSDSSEA